MPEDSIKTRDFSGKRLESRLGFLEDLQAAVFSRWAMYYKKKKKRKKKSTELVVLLPFFFFSTLRSTMLLFMATCISHRRNRPIFHRVIYISLFIHRKKVGRTFPSSGWLCAFFRFPHMNFRCLLLCRTRDANDAHLVGRAASSSLKCFFVVWTKPILDAYGSSFSLPRCAR